MLNHSAKKRSESPHVVNSTQDERHKDTVRLATALKRRAELVINDNSIDAGTRAIIRYGLEINDPWLSELIRRVDEGESFSDTMDFSQTSKTDEDLSEEKIELMVDIICRAGDEPATKAAALLVLMSTLENSSHPKALANTAKHHAFVHCSEANFGDMVEAQIPVVEHELLAQLF